MLGGQYWELVYSKDRTFYVESETYLHKEINGNNIVRAEKSTKIGGIFGLIMTEQREVINN